MKNVKREKDYRYRRGDIVYMYVDKNDENIQAGFRYGIVMTNNYANEYSNVVHVVPVTTKLKKLYIPTHGVLNTSVGFKKDSMILGEQVMPINKKRIIRKAGHLSSDAMREVNYRVMVQLGLV